MENDKSDFLTLVFEINGREEWYDKKRYLFLGSVFYQVSDAWYPLFWFFSSDSRDSGELFALDIFEQCTTSRRDVADFVG